MGVLETLRENIWARLTPPDMRKVIEAIGAGMQMTEPGWVQMYGGGEDYEVDPALREEAIKASYYYWQLDPLMSRAVQLIRDYTFGRGITWRAPDPEAKKAMNRFWDDVDNDILNRAAGQWELAERIQLAGEVFFIFFVNKLNGAVKVRVVEPHEITQIITSGQDRRRVLYYERQWTEQIYDWTSHTWKPGTLRKDYIPHWSNPDESRSTVGDEQTYICMHHVKVNSHGLRGVPLYMRVIAWIKAYKGFMEDRATMTLAAATFAFKQKIKGSAAAVARMAAKWTTLSGDASRRYGTGGQERSPGAQTFVENESSTLDQMQFNTNSANAYLDGRMLRQQVSAGTGISEQNLTGDPSVANLASATQMDGPQQKMFESWQQLWHDEFVQIFAFVVDMAVRHKFIQPPKDKWSEVDFPPILVKDLPTVIMAVAQLISAQSMAGIRYVPDQRLARYILDAFGEQDIDAALTELAKINAGLASLGASSPGQAPANDQTGQSALPDDLAQQLQQALGVIREVLSRAKR